jgi:hypothetical protein
MRFHSLWARAVVCLIASSASSVVHAAPVSGLGTWESTLQGRDLDGNLATAEAYYDTTLNITWLADASLAASNTFGLPYWTDLGMHATDNYPGIYTNQIEPSGSMDWSAALHWIDAMNATNYLGFNGWRLPTMIDIGNNGCAAANDFGGFDCGYNVLTGSAATTVYSELASLWYDTLGNLGYRDTSGNPFQPGWGLTNTGPFSNVQTFYYWFGLEYTPSSDFAFSFGAGHGYQGGRDKRLNTYAWAVHDGDVGAAIVPVPAAAWLFGSGVISLVGLARRRLAV